MVTNPVRPRLNSNQNSKTRNFDANRYIKKSNFDAYLKNINFIKFSPTHQKLQTWEVLPYFQKRGNTP